MKGTVIQFVKLIYEYKLMLISSIYSHIVSFINIRFSYKVAIIMSSQTLNGSGYKDTPTNYKNSYIKTHFNSSNENNLGQSRGSMCHIKKKSSTISKDHMFNEFQELER
jgi:hypothetical protein